MDLAERFMAKVDVRSDEECWPWTGGRYKCGYGSFRLSKSYATNAHRVAYELFVGPVPDGAHVDHLCHSRDTGCPGGDDCPHRLCVNPAHLEPVTQRTNILRGKSLQAANAAKTHCPQGHPLSGDNLVKSKLPWRKCRTCHNQQNREAAARRKARIR